MNHAEIKKSEKIAKVRLQILQPVRGLCPLDEPPGLPLPFLSFPIRFGLPVSDKLSGLAPN